jgi:hypothetical protein
VKFHCLQNRVEKLEQSFPDVLVHFVMSSELGNLHLDGSRRKWGIISVTSHDRQCSEAN